MEFEYTAPGTPQQNGLVEEEFVTLFNPIHAMLNGGKFTAFLRNGYGPKPPTLLLFFNIFLGSVREALFCSKI